MAQSTGDRGCTERKGITEDYPLEELVSTRGGMGSADIAGGGSEAPAPCFPDGGADPGPRAVAQLLARARSVEGRPEPEGERCFSWRADRLKQTVFASEAVAGSTPEAFRLCAVTDVVRRPSCGKRELLSALNDYNMRGSRGAALVYDEEDGVLRLWSSALIDEGNAGPIIEDFGALALLGLLGAEAAADKLATRVRGRLELGEDAASECGPGSERLLSLRESLSQPKGSPAVGWSKRLAFRATEADIRWQGFQVFRVAGGIELCLRSQDGFHPSITIRRAAFSGLGAGCSLSLSLGQRVSFLEGIRQAAFLNLAETRECSRSHSLGAWVSWPVESNTSIVEFVSFLPNALFDEKKPYFYFLSLLKKLQWAEAKMPLWKPLSKREPPVALHFSRPPESGRD